MSQSRAATHYGHRLRTALSQRPRNGKDVVMAWAAVFEAFRPVPTVVKTEEDAAVISRWLAVIQNDAELVPQMISQTLLQDSPLTKLDSEVTLKSVLYGFQCLSACYLADDLLPDRNDDGQETTLDVLRAVTLQVPRLINNWWTLHRHSAADWLKRDGFTLRCTPASTLFCSAFRYHQRRIRSPNPNRFWSVRRHGIFAETT